MNWFEVLAANARHGRLYLAEESPWRYWWLGILAPQVFRATVYVLLGRLVSGPEGELYALPGVVVLAVTLQTVSAISDIPIIDSYAGTYGAVTRSRVPVVAQYAARALPIAGRAAIESLVVLLTVTAVTGNGKATLLLLSAWWIVPIAIVPSLTFGLAAIAPAVGTSAQDLWHNTANVVLTLVSGAVINLESAPVAGEIGSVLPLQHAITAYRTAVSEGDVLWREIGLEAAVALVWALIAIVAYGMVDRRARSRGGGQ